MLGETKNPDSPISVFGVIDVSRPVAARLLGYSRATLNLMVSDGLFTTTGRVEKRIPLAQIEAVRGRHVSCHDYLTATTAPLNRTRVFTSPSTRREPRRLKDQTRP